MIRIVVADDEHLIREALVSLLGLEDDLEVVAQAASGDEALAVARKHAPDVAVLDLQMPGLSGTEVAAALASELSGCVCVIVTSHGLSGHLKQVLVVGVRGFVLKTISKSNLTTVIRTMHADGRHVNPELAGLVDGADPRIKSKTWDDSKITAHHGIVPTMQKGNKAALSERERNIYDLIVRAYLAQFYPLHEYMQTTVGVEIAGENFAASGKVVTRNGWRDVYSQADEEAEKDEDDDSGTQALPSMAQGDAVTCTDAARKDAKTKPPARFTEGTLIRAMENIHKFVSDAEHKKMLREGDGIGTSATRASIISELKRREFLAVKGKQIISTTLGRSVIDALPEVVKSPVLTALYERMLKGVEQGTAALDAFITKQETFIRDQVAKANSGAVTIAGGKEAAPVSSLHKCMACGSGLSRRPSKKKGQFWWGCSNFPTCKQTYPDLKGRPDYSKGRNGPASE